MQSKLKVTLIRSLIKAKPDIKAAALSIKLNKIGKTVYLENTPQKRGIVKKIIHLVKVEEEK